MRRAQRRYKTYTAIYTNYRSRRFGFASRSFYPEFLAAQEAASNARQYFQPLPPRTEPETFQLVLSHFVPFKTVAEHFQLETASLIRLNPALRPAVLKGLLHIPQGYALRLPDHEWRNQLAFNARIPAHLTARQQKALPIYRVRRGDTIAAIASRHKIKAADLVVANNLPDRGNRIYVNQALRIPLGKRPL
jgi:membrane-bound lytic murein transglycosylase D